MQIPDAPWVRACERTGYYHTTYYEDECESCGDYEDADSEEEGDDDNTL